MVCESDISKYSTLKVGSKYSSSFKTYIKKDGKIISAFHDIPYKNGKYVYCVNEIPKLTHAKFEISKDDSFNPIKQDQKKGKMRFVNNIFPTCGYPFNYGAIPQTWEDPTKKDAECGEVGDNDPIDVIDIGRKRKKIGEVYLARVLGCLALLDDNETDWKIVVIDKDDPLCEELNSLELVEKHFPNLLSFALNWFKNYKVPTGKAPNNFAFNGKYLDAEFADRIIEEAHRSWETLVNVGHESISIDNVSVVGSKSYKDESLDIKDEEEAPSALPEDLYDFYYV